MKRTLLIVLAIVMLAATVLSACGTKKEPATDDTATVTETTPEEQTTEPPKREPYKPDTDLAELDFNAQLVRILQATYKQSEFYAETGISSDALEVAVFKRNRKVEDDLNIIFDFPTVQMSDAMNIKPWKDALKGYLAGSTSDMIHLAANPLYYTTSFITENMFTELGSVKDSYVGLDKAYWNRSFVDATVINDRYYFLVGELCTSVLDRMEIMFVNNDVAANLLVGKNVNFYDLVYDYEWTYEKMLELVHTAGNGADSGVWGMAMGRNSYSIDGLLAGFEIDLIKRDEMGDLSININSDRNHQIVQALRNLYVEDPSVNTTEGDSVFRNGKAMLNACQMSNAAGYYTSGVNFSIIPMPLWDDDQADYRVVPHDQFTALTIARNVPGDLATKLTAVLEDMCYISHSTTYPAVYEKTYQLKYNDKEANADMFDYICQSLYFTTGYVYSSIMGDIKNTPRYLIYPDSIRPNDGYSASIEATLRAKQTNATEQLEQFLELLYL